MLRKLLGTKRLPQILSGFQRTLSELETLKQQNDSEIDRHTSFILESNERRSTLEKEKAQAERISDNIKKLLEAA